MPRLDYLTLKISGARHTKIIVQKDHARILIQYLDAYLAVSIDKSVKRSFGRDRNRKKSSSTKNLVRIDAVMQ